MTEQDNDEYYVFVRSTENKDIIEIQDLNTKEILHKKIRQKVM